ncbi:uncharacterized protein BX664DRAFT_356627 [Halteromyces radiatus]|uniref:uncharacterized protein n=1 Tax=Halteromyces radiatus TaxID=101107 RepID=UPI00221E9301|nr:uncharacterized protein BX664DRAFT_356627 [Halteromyces radiatus]KAI8097375.1 hypothetical protein BX664DRAFT_356627 [Halteromyces radiatus]
MSSNSRYRERKYNSSDNDRLSRILSQPVQSWEKKWAPSTRSKNYQTYKWIKSDKSIVFEDDDDDEEDEDEDEKDQVMTDADKDTATSRDINSTTIQTTPTTTLPSTINGTSSEAKTTITDVTDQNRGLFSTPIDNKIVSSLADEEERTPTPKLSDVSDVDQTMGDDDDKESNADDLNDASRHPAFAPHIHPRLNGDDNLYNTSEQTSTATTNTPQDELYANNNSNITIATTTENIINNGNNDINVATEINATTTGIEEPTTTTEDITNTSSSVPIATAPAIAPTTVESEPSPVVQQQPLPTEQRMNSEITDDLDAGRIQTPDVVSSTNTPGVDTPCDTPSDVPLQRNINVVTENDTDMELVTPGHQDNNENTPQ